MYSIFRTSSFKKQYKKLSASDKESLKEVIILLANNEILDEKYKDHKLTGNFKDLKECHIKPDLLLIYKINDNILELALVQVGNHNSLFK
ncbi:MAG TPA: type II toxin-antitoxin system YafQ family toxin [Sulfurimonas sp.]|uniref:type II toxin-antitoxin system YafQ family toxin n=1 Tax=Sulfurimonas sp. TaxID=2022749 RepID=UPI002D071ADA|nr:type II toxin-antitoxin system YafQ family toxin [Sulfurimonas sp.]HUH42242.1 type II toxin-antitoxin system YafQ family toxin [Sulfurimonas sp.]